jgi:hypothetical protein
MWVTGFYKWLGCLSSIYGVLLVIFIVLTWFGDMVLGITHVQNTGSFLI